MKKVFIGCSNDEDEMKMYADALRFLGYKPIIPPVINIDELMIVGEKHKERIRSLIDCDAFFMCHELDDEDDLNKEVSIALLIQMELIFRNHMLSDLAEAVLKSGLLKQKPIIGSIEF